ncbi:MAG: cytochrome c [Sphingobacteriales bacterium JAD_PAG50586_3]|nr:MAG: cytochrome c [Sphingobacteriales bacterium JAD_PAG50586_3]
MIQSLLLPTHKVAVIIFLLHYVIKTFLLLINKPEALKKYTAGTKVAEMIISVVFLITGVWLIAETGSPSTLQIIKFTLVALSIPIAIIGFKKGNKAMAITALLFIIGAYGLAEANKAQKRKGAANATVEATGDVVTDPAAADYNSIKHGEYIYNNISGVPCKSCHGTDGKSMVGGAKDLSVTALDKEGIKSVIKNGQNNGKMPAYSSLKPAEYDALADFVLSLKK